MSIVCLCACITSDSRSRFSACSISRNCCKPSLVRICSSVSQFRCEGASEGTWSTGRDRWGDWFSFPSVGKYAIFSLFTVNVIIPPFWLLIQSSDWSAGQTGSANLRNERQREELKFSFLMNCDCVCFCMSYLGYGLLLKLPHWTLGVSV